MRVRVRVRVRVRFKVRVRFRVKVRSRSGSGLGLGLSLGLWLGSPLCDTNGLKPYEGRRTCEIADCLGNEKMKMKIPWIDRLLSVDYGQELRWVRVIGIVLGLG